MFRGLINNCFKSFQPNTRLGADTCTIFFNQAVFPEHVCDPVLTSIPDEVAHSRLYGCG
jgi:hypothetical protein